MDFRLLLHLGKTYISNDKRNETAGMIKISDLFFKARGNKSPRQKNQFINLME